MKAEITVAKSVQSAMPEIGREEKTQYFMVIASGDEKITINVGEKTYNSIKKMEEKQNKKEK